MKNITDCVITMDRGINLKPYTPTSQEWLVLKTIAKELSLDLSISPEKGYKYAPAIKFDNMQGYVQKHISGWNTQKAITMNDGIRIEKGVTLQLEKGTFVVPGSNWELEIPKSDTKKYLKPIYEMFCIVNNKKINISEIEKILSRHPEMNELIKESYFNKEFYQKGVH